MAGVYISYPFCAQKCSYCNFASGVFPDAMKPAYQQQLLAEIESTSWPWQPETLYLGGGTPSLWPLAELKAVLNSIPGYPWREATMEAAPGSLSPERVEAWQEMGINRVSLGVQSMVSAEIRRTGRKHTAEIVAAEVALLRRQGIVNFNLDLISGLAGQTLESWQESLDAILALEPPHVSVYILEVDEDSRLGQEILLNGVRYGAPDIPSEEKQAEFYEVAVERLAKAGIQRYEVSNFALPGMESLHNLKYWRLEPYFGFGADAHSFNGRTRWQNSDHVLNYTRSLPEAADLKKERNWVGLRLTEGVEVESDQRQIVNRLVDEGLLEWAGARVRLTPRGVLLSNEVFQEFV